MNKNKNKEKLIDDIKKNKNEEKLISDIEII